jgi:hypothetical protein
MRTQTLTAAARLSTSRAAANRGAEVYSHGQQGFKLLIPASMLGPRPHPRPVVDGVPCDGTLQIGSVTLGLQHIRKSIVGRVPAAWLVDLNADECYVAPAAPPEPQAEPTPAPPTGLQPQDGPKAFVVLRSDLDELRAIAHALRGAHAAILAGRVEQVVRTAELCPLTPSTAPGA